MKRVKVGSRVDDVDGISDSLIMIYREKIAQNPEGKLAKDANMSEIATDIENLSDKITIASHRPKKVLSLKQANANRDALIRQTVKILDGFASSPLEEYSVPAKSVLGVYKDASAAILKETQMRKSPLISGLISSLDSVKADIDALPGVDKMIKALSEAQEEFNSLVKNYADVKSAKEENASELKKKLLESLNEKLVPYVTAMSKLNKEFAELEAQYDVIIEKCAPATKKKAAAKETEVKPAENASNIEEKKGESAS